MSGLLDVFGLKRKKAAPGSAPPAPDAKALAIMVKAGNVSAEARRAGVTLEDRRDTLREEIESLALAGQHQQAEKKLAVFQEMVRDGIAWEPRKQELANIRVQARQLQETGDPKASGFLRALVQTESEARAFRFAEAQKLLNGVRDAVEKRVPEWREVRLHNAEMARLKTRIDVATGPGGIPGRGVGTHALKPQWDEFETALAASPVRVTDTNGVDPFRLVFAREALDKALTALARAYATTPLTGPQANAQETWAEKEFKARQKQLSPMIQKAKYVKPLTDELAEAIDAFKAVKVSDSTWLKMLANQAVQAEKAQAVMRLSERSQPLPDEQKFLTAYGKVADWIVSASRNTDGDDPTKNAKKVFDPLWTEFQELRQSWDDDRFTELLQKLPALKSAADAVMRARLDAARNTVDAIGAPTPGTPPVPATDRQKNQRALKAVLGDPPGTGAIAPEVMKRLPVDKKIALLDGLKAGGTMPGYDHRNANATRNDPQRKAQRQVYASMDLDDRFVEEEDKQREALLNELLKDKEELKKARDDWPLMDMEARRKILDKMMKAHCKAMGFEPPKNGIFIGDLNNSDNGSYNPGSDRIDINTEQPVYNDFELAMDLIFHENSHNWQGQLVARLSPTHANPLTAAEDPPYTQALMFLSNNAAAEIVDPGEDYAGYQKQPWEDHSWTTGPKTARLLMKGLAA